MDSDDGSKLLTGKLLNQLKAALKRVGTINNAILCTVFNPYSERILAAFFANC